MIRGLILFILFSATACHPTPFDTGYESVRKKAPAPFAALSLNELVLKKIARLETGVVNPLPSFSPDGERLIYHSVQTAPEWDLRSTLNLFDIRLAQDTLVHTHVDYPTQDTYQPQPDRTQGPVFLDEKVVLGGTLDISYVPSTQRLVVHTGTSRAFSLLGSYPRVAPGGARVLLQNETGAVVVDRYGEELERHPGYFGVWAPDGQSFLLHKTPVDIDYAGVGEMVWPEDIAVGDSWEAGGLVYVSEAGEMRDLMMTGRRPSWHPEGSGFVFERFAGETWRWLSDQLGGEPVPSLFYHDIDSGEERVVVELGQHPSFHPSGAFFVYSTPQGIALSDMKQIRPLEISGERAFFSPDGHTLVVIEPRDSRDAYGYLTRLRDIVVYRVSQP